jgi:GT2 family glycosyltransferase
VSRISVVIPNWNGAARLERLLDSLRQQSKQAEEIIVVDNASNDNSQSVVGRQTGGARWIALDRNYGFARAVNAGVKTCTGESVAILNNDVTLAPDCLSILDGTLNRCWFAAPKIVQASDPSRIDGTFDLTSRGFCSWRAGHGSPADLPVWNRGTEIQSAPMTAALFRRSLFETIGSLDEQFGSYLEDVDFGIRCALKNRTGWYEPAAVATHEGSATLGSWKPASVRLISRNQLLLARKYQYAAGIWPVLAGQLAWGLVACRNHTAWAWIQGKIEGYRHPLQPFEMNPDLPSIAKTLRDQERTIRNLLSDPGRPQSYWPLYFRLCGGGD